MFKIEKNVEVSGVAMGRPSIYPFGEMEVGDSFALSAEQRGRVSTAAIKYGKRNGKKFSNLQQSDGSFRCWRVT